MDSAEQKKQRFVLGSDGLFDILDNENVGRAASRRPVVKRTASKDGSKESPKKNKTSTVREAAAKILQQCLEAGGSRDDVTICVVDVGYL